MLLFVLGGEWDRWSDWGQCTVEGFQIRRRQCKAEPCVGEKLQERKCEPTISEICKGLLFSTLFVFSLFQALGRKIGSVGDERDLGEKRRGRPPGFWIIPLTKSVEQVICHNLV